jgi:hypothetical protein
VCYSFEEKFFVSVFHLSSVPISAAFTFSVRIFGWIEGGATIEIRRTNWIVKTFDFCASKVIRVFVQEPHGIARIAPICFVGKSAKQVLSITAKRCLCFHAAR